MTIMKDSISKNLIKYDVSFLIKTPYVMCPQNDTSIVAL